MAGSAWESRGRKATSFARLVLVELRKLGGTVSDRLLLVLAPIALVAVSVVAGQTLQPSPTSAGAQIAYPMLISRFAQVLLFTAALKTFSGEWHYRSVQLTLLLQPNRRRYLSAQFVAVLVLWLVSALVEFAICYTLTSAHVRSTPFQDFIGPRPFWVLGVTLLATLLTLLFVLCIALLVPNPTAAVTVYLLTTALFSYLFRFVQAEWVGYIDPWQLAGAATTTTHAKLLPTLVSLVLLLGALVTGLVLFGRRDAT